MSGPIGICLTSAPAITKPNGWMGYAGFGTSTASPRSTTAIAKCANPSFEPSVTIASDSGSKSTSYRVLYQLQIALRRRGIPFEIE